MRYMGVIRGFNIFAKSVSRNFHIARSSSVKKYYCVCNARDRGITQEPALGEHKDIIRLSR